MKPKARGFTLVEIVIVVLVLGILLAIAVPEMLSARSTSQAKTCVENLWQMEQGKEEFAMAARLSDGAVVTLDELVPAYMKAFPVCPAGGNYTLEDVGEDPVCSISGTHSLQGTGMGDQTNVDLGLRPNDRVVGTK